MIKKKEILKKLWNFNWYKLKLFYIKNYQLDNILKNNKWIIMQIDSLSIKDDIKNFNNNKYLKKLIDNNQIIKIKRNEFTVWFDNNKDISKKYLIINNINHCKYEYRYIRYNGYQSFLIKNKKIKNH